MGAFISGKVNVPICFFAASRFKVEARKKMR